MALKEHEYIKQTLERYTNSRLEDICEYVLITNFKQYMNRFKEKFKGDYSEGNFGIVNVKKMNCTMIDFGIGSPPGRSPYQLSCYLDGLKAVVMLGMCGGD